MVAVLLGTVFVLVILFVVRATMMVIGGNVSD
jgi:hypothetical protein